jgi:hypothetical protein
MSFAINEFMSEISKNGTAKQNLFHATINPPVKLRQRFSGPVDAKHLSFRVTDVDIPGRQVQNIPYNSDIGALRKMAYGALYTDITTSIILSDDMREKTFFHEWQSMAGGEHGQSNSISSHPSAGSNWAVGYYDDYISSMVIETFDETGKPGYLCSLEECWPYMVNALQASWGSNEIHKLQVTWAFRYYRDKRGTIKFASDVNTGGFFNKSGLGALVGVGAGALAGKLGPKAGAIVGGAIGAGSRFLAG